MKWILEVKKVILNKLDINFGKDTGYGRPNMTGKVGTNDNSNKKFDDKEINEAKEHLKLLKMKLGNTGLSNNKTTNQNTQGNNYRKPFVPNFDDQYSEPVMTKKTNDYVPNTTGKKTDNFSKKPISNTTVKNTNKINVKSKVYDEVQEEDNRPAFVKKNIE